MLKYELDLTDNIYGSRLQIYCFFILVYFFYEINFLNIFLVLNFMQIIAKIEAAIY